MVTLFGTNKSKQKGFMQMMACTYVGTNMFQYKEKTYNSKASSC
jgi:hypothetical protein